MKKKYKLLKNFRNENIKGYAVTTLRNELNFAKNYLAYLRYEDPVYKVYVLRYNLIKKELERRGRLYS